MRKPRIMEKHTAFATPQETFIWKNNISQWIVAENIEGIFVVAKYKRKNNKQCILEYVTTGYRTFTDAKKQADVQNNPELSFKAKHKFEYKLNQYIFLNIPSFLVLVVFVCTILPKLLKILITLI